LESRTRIHQHIDAAALELLEFIKLSERSYDDGWVPACDIKRKLDLNLVAVPIANAVDRGPKGWLFATLARLLEDRGLVEYRKSGSRAFYRSTEE
jgi:hypothetical protein